MNRGRAFLIVLDSFGCGGAPDAAAFGDEGADTLGHIAQACARGGGDRAGLRSGPLDLPFMGALGLGLAGEASTGRFPPGLVRPHPPRGGWGFACERSQGKDTPSGHWELAGTPVPRPWGYFPDTVPCFPPDLIAAFLRETGLPGILGDRHASGVQVIEDLGAEHLRTGRPICYTSVDSVLQIAAHEEAFGLERLYECCRIMRRLVDPLNIGRVIARPFVGDPEGGFVRTANRKDFAVPPPPGTLLDRAAEAERTVVTLGKIGDIFAHRNTGREVKAAGNAALFDALLAQTRTLPDGGLVFANFVDFDTDFGHRRDVAGYAAALEAFDRRLPELEALLGPGDVVVLTADHGNDPTYRGTDHTRENVPVLAFGPGAPTGRLDFADGFADVGRMIARLIGLPPPGVARQ